MTDDLLRQLPSVDALLGRDEAAALVGRFGRDAVVAAIRAAVDETRRSILESGPDAAAVSVAPEEILTQAGARLEIRFARTLRRAVNATGILMHSGLGRAMLSEDARAALDETVQGFCTLALDIDSGRRGQRDAHVAGLLRELTGAEAATICNNNSAATVLVLNTLARGKEVIVSRGQLVEIGGSFRMPEVMSMSGAVMREVGTTNKTHLRDYADAIGPETGAILRVHHSNYRILGFHSEPGIEELAELGRRHGIPVVDDIGSGALIDLKAYGLESEPMVRASVAAGVDVACFSGDKLIGGPQSGIIVGKADIIARIKKNPLARAMRCGKLTLAAMEATLRLFLAPDKLEERHPLYRMLSLKLDDLERRGQAIVQALEGGLPANVKVGVEDGEAQTGSGSVPVETIPSKVVALRLGPGSGGPADLESLAKALRRGRPAVFTRIHKDALLFDLRTIQPEEDAEIGAAIKTGVRS
ncbi:MAG: L-seryl-tRNA(Sec) selenium transferase [Candidatus Aminicenantes bacterium]|nr:L-seryl-tRNA(Sec) selenium transferase [Candidatus Aminicenantes bacterium]